jgi:hypothetical protein
MTMSLAPLPNLKQILTARTREEERLKAEELRLAAEIAAEKDLEKITRIIPKLIPDLDQPEVEEADEADDVEDDSPIE